MTTSFFAFVLKDCHFGCQFAVAIRLYPDLI